VSWALIASEYAHGRTIFLVLSVCVLFAAVVGRWWTLVLPFVLAGSVFALSLNDGLYSRVPEDIQAGIVFGATYGLVLAIVALLVRRGVGHLDERRRATD
jgi:hypothetical protein